MSDGLTPAQLDEIEAATIRKQVVHAAVNGEPDKRFATVLALIAEVRELRAKVERVRAEVDAEVQRAQHRPGESKPDAIRRSMSRAITGRIIDALGEEV